MRATVKKNGEKRNGMKERNKNKTFFLVFRFLLIAVIMLLAKNSIGATDKSLITANGSTIYWLQNNKIYHVYNDTVLTTMQLAGTPGWSWSSITTVPSLSSYTVGPEFITNTSGLSNGLLIRQNGTNAVYYVANGKKEYLNDLTFSTRGYSFSDVIDAASTYLSGTFLPTLSLDLTTSASISSSYTSGQIGVQIPVTVYRSGDQLISGNYVRERLYLSTNTTWDVSDTVLWQSNDTTPDYPISYLNSYASKTVTATINIPSITAGTYYIIAVVDPESYHSENNENNNIVFYPVSIVSPNRAPNIPSYLRQYTTNGLPITAGGTTYESSIRLMDNISDPDGNQVKLQIELRTTSQPFTGAFTHESVFVTNGNLAEILVTGLPNGSYQWKGRTVDSLGLTSNWIDAGNIGADFIVNVSPAPTISSITPPSTQKGKYPSETFTITGTGFQNGSGFSAKLINELGTVYPVSSVEFISSTTVKVTAFIGEGLTTTQKIRIINPDGQSADINFQAIATPTTKFLTYIDPNKIDLYWIQNNKKYHIINPAIRDTMQTSGIPEWQTLYSTSNKSYTTGPEFISTASTSNGLLIREYQKQDVYRINNGKKEYISSEACIQINCWNDVIDVPAAILSIFPDAGPLLIQRTGDIKVYYVSNGYKYWIPDPETFEIIGFSWSGITTVTQTQFDNSYTTGTAIPVLRSGSARDGSLVWRGTKASLKVYLIETDTANNKIVTRHVPDPDTLYAMGRTFNEVNELDVVLFDRIDSGSPIPAVCSGSKDNTFINFMNSFGNNGMGYDTGVNTAIGNYTHSQTMLSIPGRGLPVVFTATYNALSGYNPKSTETYLMGPGWTHSYDIAAIETVRNGGSKYVRVKWGDGHEEFYEWNGTAYKADGVHNAITGGGTSNTLTLTTKDQINYTFEFPGSEYYIVNNSLDQDSCGNTVTITQKRYRLKSISDRNGNTINISTITRTKGIPASTITDTAARVITLTYNDMVLESGLNVMRLSKVSDPIGRTIEFTYDANTSGNAIEEGKLLKIKDLNGGMTMIAYNRNVTGMTTPLIATITDPRNNPYVSNLYKDSMTSFDYKNLASINLGGLGAKTFDYNSSTNETTVRALDIANKYKKDSRNRLVAVTHGDSTGKSAIVAWDDLDAPLDPSRITDRRDNPTNIDYDTNGNVLTATDALLNVTKFEYDSMNNLTKKTDALLRVTDYHYNAKGNLEKILSPIGIVSMTNNTYGQPETVTDARLNTTTYIYDTQGNLAEIREPLGRTTKFQYDTVGRKARETDPNGNVTTFEYDNNDNLTKVTNIALNKYVQFEYDENNNRKAVIDEYLNRTTYTYDARNRLESVIDPEGGTTIYGYDSINRVISKKVKVDAVIWRTTSYNYAYVGNELHVTETDSDNKTFKYIYDANGNLTSIIYQNQAGTSNTISMTYDALNRIKTRKEPLTIPFEYYYDKEGNLDYMKDSNGNTIDFEYDVMNRMTKTIYPDSTVLFTYDNNGNRKTMTDGIGMSKYNYDALNRLVSYDDPYGNIVGYDYYANNSVKSITYPGSKVVAYGYDVANRLETVTDWLNRTTRYSYDSANRLDKSVYPNGTVTTYTYDTANRLKSLVNKKSDLTTIISSYSYTLDAAGNQTNMSFSEPLPMVLSNRNIISIYDNENRLSNVGGVSYSHDSNGNLIGKGNGDSFNYDYRNKLSQSVISGKTTQYRYDGVGNRLSKIEVGNWLTKRYVLDINSDLPNVIAETDENRNITAYYVYGLGLISKVLPDGTAYYYHYDSRGSTVALTDAGQNITDAYAYDPFGKVVNSTGSTPNPFRYVGRYGLMDEGNGLTYIRARYYMPELGRFITKDPLTGNEGDGQSLNRYVYGVNNPVVKMDINGKLVVVPFLLMVAANYAINEFLIDPFLERALGTDDAEEIGEGEIKNIGQAVVNTISGPIGLALDVADHLLFRVHKGGEPIIRPRNFCEDAVDQYHICDKSTGKRKSKESEGVIDQDGNYW